MSKNLTESEKILYNLSNNLRMILTSLTTSFALLCSKIDFENDNNRKKVEDYISITNRAIYRLIRVAENLNLYGLIISDELSSKLKLKKIYPEEFCLDLVSRLEYLAETIGINIKFEGTSKGAVIDADPALLETALLQLISNAFKSTPKGETVTLRVKSASENIIFSVRDSGEGISPDMYSRLFSNSTPLVSSDINENGELGIGLFIVKAITDLHKGQVMILNLPEGGAEVTLSFPIASGNNVLRAPSPLIPSGFPSELVQLSNLLPFNAFERKMLD